MAFYYPQDSPLEIGPSAVLPGTQYYDTRITKENDGELALSGEAGTLTIIHFDLWHRAMANLTDKTRYMMKFQFVRMDAPQKPEWNVTDPHWKLEDVDSAPPGHQNTWRHVWNWVSGESNGHSTQSANGSLAKHIAALGDDDAAVRSRAADDLGTLGESAAEAIPLLIQALCDVYEPVRLNAAYALGSIGGPAVPELIETLGVEDQIMRRMAAYALAAVGEPAVSALSEALQHTEDAVRVEAAYALAQIGNPAASAIPALMERTKDECVEVRRYLAEAFGGLGPIAIPAVSVLTDMLASDDDDQARFEAALALGQIGPAASDAVPVLAKAFSDENRYVRDNVVLALKRIDTPEAESALFDYLLMARWCPITNRESTF
jgi:HEAT repeat protein